MWSINENMTEAKNFAIPAANVISGKGVLKAVVPIYTYDENRKRTDEIEGFRYTVVDPSTFDTFTLKVPGAKPVISPEELRMASKNVYIDIPLDQTVIQPYSIEYGKAKVTVSAPSVSISKN